ncbi:MAG: hypothetical protein NVSMB49_16780 [Ktedonobacteraceae bacterium]
MDQRPTQSKGPPQGEHRVIPRRKNSRDKYLPTREVEPLYDNFIPAPDFSRSPWSVHIIEQSVTNSQVAPRVKVKLIKHLKDVEKLDWENVTFSALLTPDMFGETAWAVAAMAMCHSRMLRHGGVNIEFNENPHDEEQVPPLVALQRAILGSIIPNWEKKGKVQGSANKAQVQGWSSVNEVLLPLYLRTSKAKFGPLVEFHNCMRGAFGLPVGEERTPLQDACEKDLLQWLEGKGIKQNQTTVCVWVRSKPDLNNTGDAVNNLTQEHFQTILRILKEWKGLDDQQVGQIILLGDQPDLKSKLYSHSPYTIATSASYFRKEGAVHVVDLLDYFRDPRFKAIVDGLEGQFGGSMACQMLVCDLLKREYGLQCLIGKKSGGMDGPSMIGIRQIFFEEDGASDSRMGFTALLDPVWIQVPLVRRKDNSQQGTINHNNFFLPEEEQRFRAALEQGIKPRKKQ